MKTYITKIKDEHHIVTMLSDYEISIIKDATAVLVEVFERIKAAIAEVVNVFYEFIENIDIEKLKEIENEHTKL